MPEVATPDSSLLSPHSQYDPVTAVLLSLLRRGPGPEAAELAALPEDDWTRLVRRAKVHHVAPLIYRRLVTDGLTSAVPASTLEHLRDESLRNSLHNIKIFKALGEILDALNQRGIPVMLLKGVHLAEFYYRDRTLRPMVDIDLMVKSGDYDEAAEVLIRLGYAFRYPEDTHDLHLHYPRHVGMMSMSGITVELHRTFEPPDHPKRIDMVSVWNRAQSLRGDGNGVFGLAPDDLMLHLCMHMAIQDSFSTGLIALCDVSLVDSSVSSGFPWGQLAERAVQWGSSRTAYLVLLLSKALLGVEPPEHFLPTLRPSEIPPELEDDARLFTVAGREAQIMELVPLLRLAGSLPLLLKAEALLRRVFVSRRYLAHVHGVPSGSPRIYLYHLRRVKDLLVRHGRTAWGLVRHDRDLTEKSARILRQDYLQMWLAAK